MDELFGKALQNMNAESINKQISLELAQTVSFVARLDHTDNYNPTHFDVIPEQYTFKNEITDRRN